MSAMNNLMRVTLLDMLGFESITRTSDGFYLGQLPGDVGYNAFIGAPRPVHAGPGRDETLRRWNSLTPAEQIEVSRLASNPPDGTPIPLNKEFGIP